MSTNIVMPADTRRMNYAGHIFNWTLLGEATGGALALAEIEGWQGGEPPVHVHTREDEFFILLEGEMTFMIGDETRRAVPGTVVWAPRNVPHTFSFDTPTVRLLVGFMPAGQDKVFLEFSTPAAPGDVPGPPTVEPDFEAIEAADRAAGLTYVGPTLRELLTPSAASAS